MTNFKKLLIILILIISIQCSNENNYLVEKGHVGIIDKETGVQELEAIFLKDSIVNTADLETDFSSGLGINTNSYLVYSNAGIKLLEIVPFDANDSLSKIRNIQIYDKNYITNKGITLKSTFKDINENYMVNNIETTLTSATLFIDELNATIAIDKKELGLNSFSREEITLDQIPDLAKIKYFTIWFN